MPPLLSQQMRLRVYPPAVAQEEDFSFTIKSKTGSPFTGRTSDFIAYPFAVHGYFNWRNVAIARAVCATGDTIIDIGANIGSETIGFSDVVGAAGAVYAFEPFPPNLELLRMNAAQTRHRNVDVFPLALSDHEGVVQFAVPGRGNSGIGYVLGSAGKGDTAQLEEPVLEVRCTTLDSLLPVLRRPRLIVADAEGHEDAILHGAEKLLERHRPLIVLEAVGEYLERAGTSSEQLARRLGRLGYHLFEIRRFTIAEFGTANVPQAGDWLAVPAFDLHLLKPIRQTIRRAGLMPCTPMLSPLCGH